MAKKKKMLSHQATFGSKYMTIQMWRERNTTSLSQLLLGKKQSTWQHNGKLVRLKKTVQNHIV